MIHRLWSYNILILLPLIDVISSKPKTSKCKHCQKIAYCTTFRYIFVQSTLKWLLYTLVTLSLPSSNLLCACSNNRHLRIGLTHETLVYSCLICYKVLLRRVLVKVASFQVLFVLSYCFNGQNNISCHSISSFHSISHHFNNNCKNKKEKIKNNGMTLRKTWYNLIKRSIIKVCTCASWQ